MNGAIWTLGIGLLVILAALALATITKIINGHIDTSKLLRSETTGAISPGKLQLMIITLAGAGYFVSQFDPATGVLGADGQIFNYLYGASHLLNIADRRTSIVRGKP